MKPPRELSLSQARISRAQDDIKELSTKIPVNIVGNLVADPELTYGESGVALRLYAQTGLRPPL